MNFRIDLLFYVVIHILVHLLVFFIVVNKRRIKKKKREKKNYSDINISPISFLESCFPRKNGTPRQGSLASSALGRFKLCNCFTNDNDAKQALVGLNEYSHLWIIFHFHENRQTNRLRPKVRPPRLQSMKKIGVFSTRSPHRPSRIGITLVSIEEVDIRNGFVYISGIDMIDGTPILDIKPYIPLYDFPKTDIRVAKWMKKPQSVIKNVVFSGKSLKIMENSLKEIKFYDSVESLKNAVREMILLDPRSAYRKNKMKLDCDYYIHFDKMNMLCRMICEDTMRVENIAVTYDDVKLN